MRCALDARKSAHRGPRESTLCQHRENGQICIRTKDHEGRHTLAPDTSDLVAGAPTRKAGDAADGLLAPPKGRAVGPDASGPNPATTLSRDLFDAADALDRGMGWFKDGTKVRQAARIVEAAEAVMAVAATGQIVRLSPTDEFPDELTSLGLALSLTDEELAELQAELEG